nr:MAG TPA: hypothetical protein [Caudoviricetes sp.]
MVEFPNGPCGLSRVPLCVCVWRCVECECELRCFVCVFECRLASGNQNISAYNDEDALLDVVPRETSHSNSVHERTES